MIGVDEVGRGSWAGPLLVVAARAKTKLPPDLKDSKLMTPRQRLEMLNRLSVCCEFGEGWVPASEIDEYGLANALRKGVKRALSSLHARIDETILIDGKVNYCSAEFRQVTCQVAADRDVPLVSSAAIFAKVTRDNYMHKLHGLYPGYGFDKHVGYGTKLHELMLKELGPVPGIHRNSFKPIKQMTPS